MIIFLQGSSGLPGAPAASHSDRQQPADIRDQRCEGQPPKPLVATARAPKSASLRIALRDSAKRESRESAKAMPKRKSAPAPPAAAPSPAVGDLVWVLGLGGEALEKPWPAIVRDVDTDGNSVAWPPAQVDGVRSYECGYLDHPSQDSVPDDRLLGF